MRIAVAVAVVWMWIGPSAAWAGSAECRYLDQKIAHFQAQEVRAEQLDNELWQTRFADHIEELKNRRSGSCPGYSAREQAAETARQFNELLKLAARGALTYFTMGAY